MKKSLIALAAVAASGAAMAQSSVTLYGVVDNAVSYVKGQESVSGITNSGIASSRLGFRGVEDLGNGLKAEFVLEGAVGSDDGGNGFDFKRQSTVGLTGGFGTVRLGRELTAAYNAVSRYDVFGTNGFGSTLAWSGDNTAYGVRSSNTVTYISPKFAGFGIGLNYGFGEQENNRDARSFGTGLTYDNGPLSIGFGYDQQNNAATKATFFAAGAGPVVTGTEYDLKSTAIGASYNFGVAKLAAAYKETKYTQVGATDSDKLKTYLIGVSAPVGAAGEVKLSYNNYKLDDLKAQQVSLGYVHNLSKRTAVYGTYAYLKNKNEAGFTLNGAFAGAGVNESGKQQGLQVGVRHAF